jgi:hypothetical protein
MTAAATAATAQAETAEINEQKTQTDDKIYIHEDHNFKSNPATVYYTDTLFEKGRNFELGTFEFNQYAYNAGIHGWGDGECKFSKHKFNRECPYSVVYYRGVKQTPGTTIGPEYEFTKHSKERIFYRTDSKTGNPIKLGKILDYGAPYDAGFNGMSTGFSIFEFDKTSFRNYDCRNSLPVRCKVYYLE